MISRRLFVVSAALLALAPPARAATPVANDPLALVNAIYTRVVSGNGDLGGSFMMGSPAQKAKYFSKSLLALWAKADAHTPKGDVGPIDFDPATNSQDPSVKSFVASVEKSDVATATIMVKLTRGQEQARKYAEDDTLHYDYVRDGGHWKIDDIRGSSDGRPWSMRDLMTFALKN